MTCVIPLFAPEHRIKSVTIFKSTNLAEIVRTFEINLKVSFCEFLCFEFERVL